MVPSSIGATGAQTSLVVVGAASRDITSADPRGWRLGGGVTYGALAAARLGVRVRALVGVDGVTAAADELELLSAAGVDLVPVSLERGPAMENRDTPAGRVQLVHQASDQLPATALPDDWRNTPALLLAPVAGELADEWAAAVPGGALVALAWQGVFRRLVPGQRMVHLPLRRTALVARADIALVSADDATAGGWELRRLLRRDGQQLVVTHGAHGALHLVRRSSRLAGRHFPALPADAVRDATGAGDVFLATWCAAQAGATGGERPGEPWAPLAVAAAAASLKVEHEGLDGVPTLADVCRRITQPPAGRDGRDAASHARGAGDGAASG